MSNNNDKPKPTIEIQEIKFSEEDQLEISRLMQGLPQKESIENQRNRGVNIEKWLKYRRAESMISRKQLIKKKFYKGICCICADWPSHKIFYKYPGDIRVEYFCQSHLPNLI